MMDEKYPQQVEHEEGFDIENFFDDHVPTLAMYRDIKAHTEFGSYQTEFTDFWRGLWDEQSLIKPSPEDREKIKKYLQSVLRGQILIDLGCGEGALKDPNFTMGNLVKKFDVGHYIGIDSKDSATEQTFPPPLPKPIKIPHLNNGHYINGDMLLTLATVPHESANIVINGIDSTIVRPQREHVIAKASYNHALAAEMTRACRRGGIIFGYNSTALEILQRMIRDGRLPNFRTVELIANQEKSLMRSFEKLK